MPLSRAHLAVRSASRPATAAASPPASRTAGRKFLRAMPAVPMTPHRTTMPSPLAAAILALPWALSCQPRQACRLPPALAVMRAVVTIGRSAARPNVEDIGVKESSVIPGGAGGATTEPFRGVGVALVTIFGDDGEVDPGATGKLAGDLVTRGMRAAVG